MFDGKRTSTSNMIQYPEYTHTDTDIQTQNRNKMCDDDQYQMYRE